MQLSLASTSASSEPADLLIAPAASSSEEPATGFGDLMADLLPANPSSADPDATAAAVAAAPLATEAAAVQAVTELLAWLARTPPPPPPASGPANGDSMAPELGMGSAPGLTDSEASLAPALDGQNRIDIPSRRMGGDAFAVPPSQPQAATSLPLPVTSTAAQTQPPAFAGDVGGTELPMAALPNSPEGDPARSVARLSNSGVDPASMNAPAAIAGAAANARTPQVGSEAPAAPSNPVLAAAQTVVSGAPGSFRIRSETRGEKIAALGRPLSAGLDRSDSAAEKNFLNVDSEGEGNGTKAVGIGVAKADGTMSNPALPTFSPSPARPDSGVIGAVVESSASQEDFSSTASPTETPESVAHAAVAAVAKAVERAEAAPRTAVNLQFAIGDSDLVVRIEHRADEVRATFRTDSSELRAALSQEWQSAATGGSEQALRRVEPVFTSAASNDDGRSSAEGQSSWSQQRQAGREAGSEPSTPFAAFLRRPLNASTSGAEPVAAARPASVSTALHLQTFA